MSGITSLFQYDFMVSAFIAVLIITPLYIGNNDRQQ